jgi:hypothetical protein
MKIIKGVAADPASEGQRSAVVEKNGITQV